MKYHLTGDAIRKCWVGPMHDGLMWACPDGLPITGHGATWREAMEDLNRKVDELATSLEREPDDDPEMRQFKARVLAYVEPVKRPRHA